MSLHKWNEALIDWVNCLSLTAPIKDISELEDGRFFQLLLKTLSLQEKHPESDLSSDGFALVYHILRKEFPSYEVFDIEKEVDTRLSYISSLLLLLSITKGKNSIFRDRLCEDLPNESQIKLKFFLERCIPQAESLDHKRLKCLLERDLIPNETITPHNKTNVISLFKTPMKEFFDSPRQRDKFTREIKKLEIENEALLVEKTELEDELRVAKLEKQQLEGNLQSKIEQVGKLREELHEFILNKEAYEKNEGKGDNNKKIQNLMSQIKELESSTHRLIEEKSVVNEAKEKLEEKVSILQDENRKLEARAFQSELKNEELNVVVDKKELDLQAMKEHVFELEEKIRSLSKHNLSIESDSSVSLGGILSSPYSEGECLSNAVVDVKLADAEEENEKLIEQIKTISEEQERLTEQLADMNNQLEKARKAQDAAMEENMKIQSQLKEALQERDNINVTLCKSNQQLSELQEINSVSNKQIADLHSKLKVAVELNNQLEQHRLSLENEVCEKQKCLNEIKNQLVIVTLEKEDLMLKRNDLENVNNDLSRKLEEENQKYFMIENSLIHVEKNVITSITSAVAESFRAKILEIPTDISVLNKIGEVLKLLADHNQEEKIEKENFKTYIASLENEVRSFQDANQNLLQQKCKFENDLSHAENKIDSFKTEVLDKEREIKELMESLNEKESQLKNTSEEVKNYGIQLAMIHKDKDSALEIIAKKDSELKNLKDQFNEEKKLCNSVKADQDTLIACLTDIITNDVGNNIIQVSSEFSSVADILQLLRNYNEFKLSEKDKLNAQVESLEGKLKFLEEDKKKLMKEKCEYEKQISDFEKTILDVETKEIQQERRIEELTVALSEKQSQLEISSEKIKDCEFQLEKTGRDQHLTLKTISIKDNEIKKLKDQLDKMEEFSQSLKSDQESVFAYLIEVITKDIGATNQTIKYDLRSVKEVLQLLGEYLQTKSIEKEKFEAYVMSLESEKQLLQERNQNVIHQFEEELSFTKDKIGNLEMKITEQEKKIEEQAEELSEKKSVIEKTSKKIKDYEVQLEVLGKCEESAYETLRLKDNEIRKLRDHLDKEIGFIQSLKSELEAMKNYLTDIITKDTGIKNLKISPEVSKVDGVYQLLKDYNRMKICEKEKMKTHIETLENEASLLEETNGKLLQQKCESEKNLSDAENRIKNLENKLMEQEKKSVELSRELSEKYSQLESASQAFKEYEIRTESIMKEKESAIETVAMKESDIKRLKDELAMKEKLIQSLKSDQEALMLEKKQKALILDELRTTIDTNQQELGSIVEERISLENQMKYWKSHSEELEKIVQELKAKLKVQEAKVNQDDHATDGINSFEKKNKEMLNITMENLFTNQAFEDSLKSGSATSEGNNLELMAMLGDLTSVNVPSVAEQVVENEKLKQLDVEERICRLVSSWNELEILLEKLEVMRNELKTKISSLWKIVPRIQSKCKKLFHTKELPQSTDKEMEQSKQVSMRLESMIRSLEKQSSSLDTNLMHLFLTSVSWGLEGIQDQFGVKLYEGIQPSIMNLNEGSGSLIGPEDKKLELCASLNDLSDKFSQVLEEVNSTADIFQEVEMKCESVADTLEYLKRNCLFEEEMLNVNLEDVTAEKKDEKCLQRALEEMEIAKENLERITFETQRKLEKVQMEKEDLSQKVANLISKNAILESQQESTHDMIECVRQETIENVKAQYEEKLEKMKAKFKAQYMEDLTTFKQKNQQFDQLKESYLTYKSVAVDYEKKLIDATARNKDLMNKIEILKKQKSLLEDKIKDMNSYQDSTSRKSTVTDLNKSYSVDNIADYFSKGRLPDPPQTKFQSERNLVDDDSSSMSSFRESAHNNLPSGMGKVFCAEDEEGEMFNATYLADLKAGNCAISSSGTTKKRETLGVLHGNIQENHSEIPNLSVVNDTPMDRLNELVRRNTLCLPHLKSSYPTETQFHDPKNFNEDYIKGTFSQKVPLLSESQPRRYSGNLYGDLRRRKDMGQTSYMKPGPPTPGKNRRSSLQGNEKDSEHGKPQSTPGRFRSWFGRGKRGLPANDAENIPVTPRTKQKGILRRAFANME